MPGPSHSWENGSKLLDWDKHLKHGTHEGLLRDVISIFRLTCEKLMEQICDEISQEITQSQEQKSQPDP